MSIISLNDFDAGVDNMDAVVQSAIIKVAGDWALANAKGEINPKGAVPFITNFELAYKDISSFIKDHG